MSLFGNLGNSSSNPPAGGSSLFGSVPSTAAPSTSAAPVSLFGSLTAAPPTSQPSQSLFGSTYTSTTTPASGSSLFGHLNSSKPAEPPKPSLFGSAAPATSAGSLFGSSTIPSAPAASSLFGNPKPASTSSLFPTVQQTQAAPSSSLFGASTVKPADPQPTAGSSVFGQPQVDATASVAPPNAPQSTYFDNLLQRGQKLDSNKKTPTTGLGELPSLQLGLGDISRRVRELGNAGNTAFEPKLQQARAKHLLAASGVQTVATVRDLQELGADISSEPYVAPEADIDADINYGYATSLLDMIDEANDRSIRDFDKWIAQEIKFDWEEQKRQIYEHFNLMPKTSPNRGDDRGSPSFERLGAFGKSGRRAATPSRSSPLKRGRESVFAASAAQRSVLGSASHVGAGQGSMFGQIDENSPVNTAGIDPTSKEKQHQYETKVRQLNDQRVRGDFYAVLENFAEVPAQLANGNQFNSQMHDCYRALAEITGESSSGPNPPDHQQVKQGMYATDYLDDVEMSERSTRMKKVITNGSRKYLERKCFAELEDLVQRNPREARLGGLPSVTAKVKAYVNVRSARKDLTKDGVDLQQLGDEPCWVVIFFLVRTGHVQEALEYVTSNQSAFRAIDRWFLAYIRDYANHPDRRLRREYQEKISTDYLARERISAADTLDPYRMAVYKVIGRCRLEQRSFEGLQTNMDDWVWLQFALARESSRLEESASETFGLTDVRGVIKEIGQRHFAKNSDANSIGTYFYLQMLAGIFEQAVAYLYAHDYVDAVHFAIALNFYGLLRVSSFSEPELLSFTVRGHGRLAFARMIGYYTRDFRAANVEAAVDYLTMIALNSHLAEPAGSSQAELCRDALRELVLETRAFSKLLGDAKKDGMKTPGLIEKRLSLVQVKKGDEKEFIRTLSIQAGNLADQNGRQKDAVLLMHLAGEYNQVIESINRMLSEVIAIELGQETPKISDPPVGQNSNGAGEQDSSLSLVDVQDPIQLAKNIVQLYDKDAIYYSHISPANKDACGTLLTMVEARSLVEAGKWMEAFEKIANLQILPLEPSPPKESNTSLIRSKAAAFSSLNPAIARNIGPLLVWTMTSCKRLKADMLSSGYDVDGIGARRDWMQKLDRWQNELSSFTGQIRYRLREREYAALNMA